MKVLIIEDEELAVKKLTRMIESLDRRIEIVGSTDSVESSVEWFLNHEHPDLVFMDIELLDGQSFDIFGQVDIKCPVIFTTSYDEYALKAFKVNSLDYLLKPVQKEELSAALDKYDKHFGEKQSIDIAGLVSELQQKLQPKSFRKRFLVKNGSKLLSIDSSEIMYFYSDERLNFFKTRNNKKFIVDYTMDELEDMLDQERYFRISRAFIVAIDSVDQIHDYFGNRLLLHLLPAADKEALVSREKVSDFKRWLGK